MPDNGRRQGGFTLLEIMVAMTILAVGSVSIISLFAAAVQLERTSWIEDEAGLMLPELESIAQDTIDRFVAVEGSSVPEPIAKTEFPGNGFYYELTFQMADKDLALPGEAYWVDAKIYPRENDKPIELVRTWFLKRQVFSEEEIERSVTYEAEREGLEDREARDRRRESGRGDR